MFSIQLLLNIYIAPPLFLHILSNKVEFDNDKYLNKYDFND